MSASIGPRQAQDATPVLRRILGSTAQYVDRKKVRPALGDAGRARTRSGDGEGWGRDRDRVSPRGSAMEADRARTLGARASGGGRRPRIAQRNPMVRIALRLALDEAVAGLRPEQDLFGLVVEHELALVGLHREYGVAVALLVAHHGDQQRLARPAGPDQ